MGHFFAVFQSVDRFSMTNSKSHVGVDVNSFAAGNCCPRGPTLDKQQKKLIPVLYPFAALRFTDGCFA